MQVEATLRAKKFQVGAQRSFGGGQGDAKRARVRQINNENDLLEPLGDVLGAPGTLLGASWKSLG